MKFFAEIDNGQGGDKTITADTIGEALVEAIDWAKGGDWPEDGCEVEVRVWTEDEDGEVDEEEEETVHIHSKAEQEDEEVDGGEVLAEDRGEYSTERVVRVGDELYYQHKNGGDRGAHSRQGGDGKWRERPVEPTRQLSRSEAICLLLDWRTGPADVAELLEGCE